MSHLGGYVADGDPHTFLPDIWGYILLKYKPTNILDVGCGTGHALKWFRDYGKLSVLGIEGDVSAIEKSVIPIERIRPHDYTSGPLKLNGKYDLGLSLEFLEHVEEKYINNFMVTFTSCKYLLVSHAIPGQDGHHHVNCQNKEYWIDCFKKNNFVEITEETKTFVETNKKLNSPWCRGNLIFFKNENF